MLWSFHQLCANLGPGVPLPRGLVRKPAAAGGRGHMVWNQRVAWVGGVRLAVGGLGIPQRTACNCGHVDTEKWGPVTVFRWSSCLVRTREDDGFYKTKVKQRQRFILRLLIVQHRKIKPLSRRFNIIVIPALKGRSSNEKSFHCFNLTHFFFLGRFPAMLRLSDLSRLVSNW